MSETLTTLQELARLFLKLGLTAFGGPAAHIAMMEDEVVRRKKWLSPEEFLDLLGATNLIPGPNSTEMALHIGRMRAGWRGLLVAGICFITPAVVIVLAFAWIYIRFKSLPQIEAILYGIKPVVVAVVIQALWGLSKSALKTRLLTGLGVLVALANVWGANELILLLAAGLLMVGVKAVSLKKKPTLSMLALPFTGVTLGIGTTFSLGLLFFVFLKIGAVLFGSGYVLLAFLRADLVNHLHWLTEGQLLDAVAVGQVTPGPVFTTATFIGYLLGGLPGAIVATIGIFLPGFIFVAASGPLIPHLRKSKLTGAFLDGVNVASLALMFVVTIHLGKTSVIDATTLILAILSAVLLLRFRVNSAWLILSGSLVGLATLLLHS